MIDPIFDYTWYKDAFVGPVITRKITQFPEFKIEAHNSNLKGWLSIETLTICEDGAEKSIGDRNRELLHQKLDQWIEDILKNA